MLRLARLTIPLLFTLSACFSGPSGPSAGPILRVTTTSSGDPADPDGYFIGVDCQARDTGPSCLALEPVPANGVATVALPATGHAHAIRLTGLSFNCGVLGDSIRTVAPPALDVAFEVRCSPVGSVRVAVATTGVDPDADGYIVTLTNASVPALISRTRVSAGESSITIPVVVGTWTVELQDVAFSCDTEGPSRGEIEVTSGSMVEINHLVHCRPAPELIVGTEFGALFRLKGNDSPAFALNLLGGGWPVWSPDGTQFAYVALAGDGGGTLHIAAADGSASRAIADQIGWGGISWSPDGEQLLVSKGLEYAQLYVVPLDMTPVRQLISSTNYDSSPSWSPDGRRIAFTRNGDLMLANADGSGVTRLRRQGRWGVSMPVWSPDGQQIVYAEWDCFFDPVDCFGWIWVIGADGSDARSLEAGGLFPSWTADGEWITFQGPRSIEAIRPDGSGRRQVRTGVTLARHTAWRPGSTP